MTTKTHKEPRPHVVRLRVSDQELQWLREEAKAQDRSIANLLQRALRVYLDSGEAKT